MRRAAVSALCAAMVLVSGCSYPDKARFDEECAKRGGFVAETATNWWGSRIDCIVDNKVVYLPGFA